MCAFSVDGAEARISPHWRDQDMRWYKAARLAILAAEECRLGGCVRTRGLASYGGEGQDLPVGMLPMLWLPCPPMAAVAAQRADVRTRRELAMHLRLRCACVDRSTPGRALCRVRRKSCSGTQKPCRKRCMR
jgi:hypothetical protein